MGEGGMQTRRKGGTGEGKERRPSKEGKNAVMGNDLALQPRWAVLRENYADAPKI